MQFSKDIQYCQVQSQQKPINVFLVICQGYYSVYREVFFKIAEEDRRYMEDDCANIPGFGDSQSSYEEVVMAASNWKLVYQVFLCTFPSL